MTYPYILFHKYALLKIICHTDDYLRHHDYKIERHRNLVLPRVEKHAAAQAGYSFAMANYRLQTINNNKHAAGNQTVNSYLIDIVFKMDSLAIARSFFDASP